MGQAKQRGTFEQRKADGAARLQADAQRRRTALAAQEATMTPAEREARKRAQRTLAMMLGLVAGSGPGRGNPEA